ncbi:autophagy-like protein 9 [Cryptococcus gattii Ru294]|nr:autophagy-like protein 9 [Cryptococcus gattii Ru294]
MGKAEGYLDPTILSVASGSRNSGKAKERTKRKGGHKYHSLHAQEEENEEPPESEAFRTRGKVGLNAYEKALWKWVNVDDLDGFLQEVYEYYKGKGIYCIVLARVLNLLTTFFVIAFSTFLISCIDYTKLFSSLSTPEAVGRLEDVLIGQCITKGSFAHTLFLIILSAFFIFQVANFAISVPRLLDMYRFYTHLLGVPDADIQTLPWPEIVRLIGDIRKHNPVTSLSNGQATALADMVGNDAKAPVKKLDAHDIANRILRQENYLIALFNKDLLDLRVRIPVPHIFTAFIPSSMLILSADPPLPSLQSEPERKFLSFGANHLTKALEWNLRFCLLGYLFDRRGQVRKEFVKEKRRKDLVQGLRRRFVFMGILNAIFAPFIILYLLIYSFFRYFEEYHKNPSSIGSRQYTPYAQWKFREFNELPHLFERRLDRSYETAKEYVDQFPKERTALVMRFVAFVAGSFAAVLLVASLIDPDLFLHFEITPHRTVLFYLGVFGSVLAISRGMVPQENMVFDPEASLNEVVRWTHYLPVEWRGQLHSQMVHQEFSKLFALKIMIFFSELLSVILTPFILFFSLPPCAAAIIDFFREFTVHVDGVGYVCSFAVFDFARHGNIDSNRPETGLQGATGPGAGNAAAAAAGDGGFGVGKPGRQTSRRAASASPSRFKQKDWRSNENKMEQSFLHFKATHPDWQPSDPSSSLFLDRLMGAGTRNRPAGGISGSIYGGGGGGGGGGGRGLGIDGSVMAEMEEERLRAKRQSYERAWAKSSHLHRPDVSNPLRHPHSAASEIIEEEEGGEGDKGDDSIDGWSKRMKTDGETDDEEEEHGRLWKDDGVVGLLQQVLGR